MVLGVIEQTTGAGEDCNHATLLGKERLSATILDF